jgi:hypothetical protein
VAVGHVGLRHDAQRAGGELGGLGQVGRDRVAAVVDAAQAVVVAMVPGRAGVEQAAERGEVGVGERLEDGADDIGVGAGGWVAVSVLAVMTAPSLIASQEP